MGRDGESSVCRPTRASMLKQMPGAPAARFSTGRMSRSSARVSVATPGGVQGGTTVQVDARIATILGNARSERRCGLPDQSRRMITRSGPPHSLPPKPPARRRYSLWSRTSYRWVLDLGCADQPYSGPSAAAGTVLSVCLCPCLSYLRMHHHACVCLHRPSPGGDRDRPQSVSLAGDADDHRSETGAFQAG